MLAALCAAGSIAAVIASFFLAEPAIVNLLVVAAVAALLAAFWKARPIFLLSCFIALVLGFICQPPVLAALLQTAQITLDLTNPLHVALVSIGGFVATFGLFAISCRRQTGGVRLSAQEASDDLERLVSIFGKLAAFLFIPLLLVPLIEMLRGLGQSPLDNLAGSLTTAQIEQVGHLVALIMIGGLASSYMQNLQHRYPMWRRKRSETTRAWLEFFCCMLLLLPICWIMIELTWHHANTALREIRILELSQSMSVADIALGGFLPFILPLGFSLLACTGIAVMLRSLVFVFGPPYLKKRAATHIDIEPVEQNKRLAEKAANRREWGEPLGL